MNCCEAHASELRCDDCPWCRIAQLEAQIATLAKDAKFVYDDLKMRAGDGVVPISHSAWEKVCRMTALIQESE